MLLTYLMQLSSPFPCLDMDVTQQQSWGQELAHRDRGSQWPQGKVTQKAPKQLPQDRG